MRTNEPVFDADVCPQREPARSTESHANGDDATPLRIEMLKQLAAWIDRIRLRPVPT